MIYMCDKGFYHKIALRAPACLLACLLVLSLISPCAFATYVELPGIFNTSIIPKSYEALVSTVNIKPNSLCIQGFVQYCERTVTTNTTTVYNTYVSEPFNDDIAVQNYGEDMDPEDIYTSGGYNLTGLLSATSNETDLIQVYKSTKDFVRSNGMHCRASASAFKLALLNSQFYKDLRKSPTDPDNPIHIYKAFYYDGGVYSHRFLLLEDKNGYYVLDPLQCEGLVDEFCIYQHTKYFYDVPGSINYRGEVYRLERII